MKLKVCGLRDPENIRALLELGLDYTGLLFYPKSSRYVGEDESLADWIARSAALFGDTRRVGVFVNAELELLLNAIHDYGLQAVQLHGDEQPEYLAELRRFARLGTLPQLELIKAFGLHRDFDFGQTEAYAGACDYFLFDTHSTARGGTGQSFDWAVLDHYAGETPFFLSGGIGPDSAEALTRFRHPAWAGIDLNSRFEIEPGLKDVDRIRQFIQQLEKTEVI